jgi:hypothetical protein
MKEFRCADLIEGEKYHQICPIWSRPSESSVWFETVNGSKVYKIQYSNNDIDVWHPDRHLTRFVRIA